MFESLSVLQPLTYPNLTGVFAFEVISKDITVKKFYFIR